MRLPAHLVTALLGVAACEPAHDEPRCAPEPVQRPAAGPKLVQPPKPDPQPTRPDPQPVAKKPEKRMVWASVCGHTELVDAKAALMRCGRG